MIDRSKKELNLVMIFSIFTAFLVLVLSLNSLYQVNQIHKVTENIYKHPLKVSNAALNVKLNVIKIHRDMKDVVLFKSDEELLTLIESVNKAEEEVYSNLLIIKKNILGNEGLNLQNKTKILFENWKPIRDEVIDLVNHEKRSRAIEITKGKGAKHVLSLEESASDLYKYAHIKAEGFKAESYEIAKGFEGVTIVITLLFLSIFGLFSLYIYFRIKKYILQVDENEQKYLIEKKYLHSVFDVIPQIMITTDGKEIERVNLAMLQFFEYESSEQFKNDHECICDYFIHEKDCITSEVNGTHWLEYILKNQDKLHKVCMKKDTTKYYFVVNAHKLELDGRDRAVVTFSDVSEVENLRARLEIAVNGTNDGLWDWNLETNEIYFSSRWKEQLGYSDDELENSLETWERQVHPDDKEQAVKDFTANMEARTDVYENIHRLRHKNGSWVWILDRGQTEFDVNGKAIRMVGFHTDITRQKELELELIENEKLYYDFFENTKSANIMYSTDDDGKTFKIKALNSLVEELEGVNREDIVGRRVDEVFEGIKEFGLLDVFKEVYITGEAKKTPLALYDDGERKGWRENYVFKLSNGDIVASYEDRTQEKKLDLLLSNTINSVNNLIFVKDNHFKYLECNSAFENFLGLPRGEIIGRSDYDLFDKEIADFFRAKDEEMLRSQKMKYNYEWVTYPNGSKKYLLTVKAPLRDDNGTILGLVGNSVDMSEHKKLEDELKASQKQFEQFMEFMPANIIIKENDVIVYANSKTNDFFKQDTIVGKTVEELFSDTKSQELINFEEEAYKKGFNEEVIEVLSSKGNIHVYRNMAFIISNEVERKLGIVSIDITTEYNANKEIARVLSAFERSDISVVITDITGAISYVNPSWCKATGYSKEELIGENPRIVKSGAVSSESYEKMWHELTNGRIWTSELKNRAKDGTEFWEDSTIMPSFDVKGTVDGYIAFKLDITDKINLRQELKNKEELMIAQSRHAAMGEMISMIAHQWRQPISVIAMEANNILADIELDTLDSEELHETSKDIISQTQELSKTIDDFREFFKPNKDIENILIIDVINDALNVIGKSLENNNIELVVKVDNKVSIETFSRELMQVLINIIKNAKETFMEQELVSKNIFITLESLEKDIILTICDNAGGIEIDIINEIFEPYFTTKSERNGTGLGLYMSKTIVEKHLKGILTAENSESGACFEIVLPMKIDMRRSDLDD